MLKKHVEMGDNDSSTKEALLKDDMLSHAAEINCACFPLTASSLGSHSCLEKFKEAGFTRPVIIDEFLYNQEFLDQFFKSVQSTTTNLISSSESCEWPTPKCPRLESNSITNSNSDSTHDYNSDTIYESDNRYNITCSTSKSCESPTPKRPRLQFEARTTDNNKGNITGLLTNNNFNCLKPGTVRFNTCRNTTGNGKVMIFSSIQ